ncbi:acylphosphatase [Clostridium sp. DJ247]|uniref:acylphosphatase n=1 Tax=Clostridium sp. DJ247 TaxID=2726188 RepID=UPI0028BEADCE|nr:acylphosphatase [Clostridium sp. DJ247]
MFGRVQGVGFRYHTAYTASSFGLTGWVKNCDNGSVELEVQGEYNSLTLFVEKLKHGNRFAKVDNLSLIEIEPKNNEKSFKVIY